MNNSFIPETLNNKDEARSLDMSPLPQQNNSEPSQAQICFHDADTTQHHMKKVKTNIYETPIKDVSSFRGRNTCSTGLTTSGLTIMLNRSSRKGSLDLDNTPLPVCRKLDFDFEENKDSVPNNSSKRDISQIDMKAKDMLRTERLPTDSLRPTDSSPIRIGRQVECRYCGQPGDIRDFIRPCLCSGSIQYVHQDCLQKDIEENYMDKDRVLFLKDLRCQICQFPFVIKTYENIKLNQALLPQHQFKFFVNVIAALLLITFLAGIISASVKDEGMRYKPYLIFLLVLGCMVSMATILFISYRIMQLLLEFHWKVQDRVFHTQNDNGQLTDIDTLKRLLSYFRQRRSDATILPE